MPAVVVSVSLDSELVTRIDEIAKRENKKRSAVIEELLRKALEVNNNG